jgi:hypothetical protein
VKPLPQAPPVMSHSGDAPLRELLMAQVAAWEETLEPAHLPRADAVTPECLLGWLTGFGPLDQEGQR